jgi:hypothetical protein
MFKKLGLPALVLGTALTLLNPVVALARDNDREHHRHRFSLYFGYGPRYNGYGYYDGWGYWHPYRYGYSRPYGFYDRWGYWHPY